jgi:uncharacterized LabA/DUF88 family protein
MTRTALFIDLANFYSHLLKSGLEKPRFIRDYFLHWLDLDLLAKALTNSFIGIWVFYSSARIGPSNQRIEGKYLIEYIDRINALEGVTARDVNIPGRQRESYRCEKCGHDVKQKSEKGIDASLTVHMIETMDSWDVAYLLSGDADFVPVTAFLRRKGKTVIGAGFSSASSALTRECYQYVDVSEIFLSKDIIAYTILKPEGIAESWLTDEVLYKKHALFKSDPPSALATVTVGHRWNETRGLSCIWLDVSGFLDLSSRHQQIAEFQTKFPNQSIVGSALNGGDAGPAYSFILDPLVSVGVKRRLATFGSSIENLRIHQEGQDISYWKVFQFNSDTHRYEPGTRTRAVDNA